MPNNYILRISKDEYEQRVFDQEQYYVGVRGKWEPGVTIFLARKRKVDSFIGQASVERVVPLDKMTEAERKECKQEGWRWRLDFGETLREYKEPLPIREVMGKNFPVGRILQGYRLTDEQKARIRALATKS